MAKKSLFILLGSLGGLLIIGIALTLVYSLRKNPTYDYMYDSYNYVDGDMGMPMDSMYLEKSLDEYAPLASEEMVNDQEGSKVQKNGSVSFLVENIDESIVSLKAVNTTFGGQVTNIYDYGRGNERSVSITVKVPVEKFETYYEALRELEGEVTYANVSTLDVTEEYIDITSRLANLKSTETQLVKVLEKAEKITDILAVQRELNTVRGDIESYEQRKRYFDSQTDYSYITISFSIDKTGINVTEDQWKPWGEVKAAVKSLIELLKGFVNLIIWIVIFSPIVLVPFLVIRYLIKRRKTEK